MVTLAELRALANEIDQAADGCCPGKELSRYLRDNDPVYHGMGSADVDRLRAYALAALARTTAESGLAAAREEIETGTGPGPVAAAARIVAALEAPRRDWLARLVAAAERVRSRDRKVWYDRIDSGARPEISDTAMVELARAFIAVARYHGVDAEGCSELLEAAPEGFCRMVRGRLVSEAVPQKCCPSGSVEVARRKRSSLLPAVLEASVEDQDGYTASLGERLLGRPTVLAFFYTRCMNPLKCSRTVSVLAELARHVARCELAGRVGVFGMSYDPAWDTAARLYRFGIDRGMDFSPEVALLRAIGNWDQMRSDLDLAVGYGPATVNRHRIEVLVMNPDGRVVFDCDGRPPEVGDLLARLKKELPPVR